MKGNQNSSYVNANIYIGTIAIERLNLAMAYK